MTQTSGAGPTCGYCMRPVLSARWIGGVPYHEECTHGPDWRQQTWQVPSETTLLQAEIERLRAWRDTVDEMLAVCHEAASEDPRESINRLINWHAMVALDPCVSSDAAKLANRDVPLLQQALEALKLSVRLYPDVYGGIRSNALVALRERLMPCKP